VLQCVAALLVIHLCREKPAFVRDLAQMVNSSKGAQLSNLLYQSSWMLSMLQSVAVFCSGLQSFLQKACICARSTAYETLCKVSSIVIFAVSVFMTTERVAVCCSGLQCLSVYCVSIHQATFRKIRIYARSTAHENLFKVGPTVKFAESFLMNTERVAVCCSDSQCLAVCCVNIHEY